MHIWVASCNFATECLHKFQLFCSPVTLTVWSYAGWHQAEGLLHRTCIALSLAQGLSQSDWLFPSVQKTCMDTYTKTRSHQSNGDHAQGPRHWSVSPRPTRPKQRKRGGKCRSGRGRQRCKMRKADRLSKRYSRVCSWNCASANR